jgi:PAS domain S-box-containing protein
MEGYFMSIMQTFKSRASHLKNNETAKVISIIVLILFCLWVTSYYHFVLRSNVLVTHFFYLPVVVSCFWWGRRAIWIAVFLGGYLLGLHYFIPYDASFMVDLQRMGILISVSIVISMLREASLKTERALRASENKFRDIFDNANDLIQSVDAEGNFTYVNKKWLDTMGYSEREVNNLKFADILRRDQVAHCMGLFRKISLGEPVAHVDTVFIAKDGREIVVEGNANARFEEGKFIASRAIFRDVTDRKQTENFIKGILGSLTEGLITIDRDYKIMSANKAYCNYVKMPVEDVIGQYCYKVSHHIDMPCHQAGEDCASRHTFETGKPHGVIHIHYDNDGSPLYLDTRSYPVKDASGKISWVIETLNDITGKVKLQEQLRYTQKMASVGQLSGGIAHDFNNILAGIIGNANILKIKMGGDGSLNNNIENILILSERASNLIKGLLIFSRAQSIRKETLPLRDILRKMGKLLPNILGNTIALKIRDADGDINLIADPGRLEEVFRIFAENARYAMPYGGIFSITTARVEADRTFTETHEAVKYGSYMLISFADTGAGMDQTTAARLFERFVMTNEAGAGLGMGLAIAYGIITLHEGYVDVQSELNKGTTFKIYLPLAESGTETR